MATRYDVFLSHASAEKPDVENLARKPPGLKPGAKNGRPDGTEGLIEEPRLCPERDSHF